MATKPLRMQLKVSKWGNSLAVRLPAEAGRQIGVGDGDILIAQVSDDGCLVLARQGHPVGAAEARRLRRLIERQKQTSPVVGDMRHDARF